MQPSEHGPHVATGVGSEVDDPSTGPGALGDGVLEGIVYRASVGLASGAVSAAVSRHRDISDTVALHSHHGTRILCATSAKCRCALWPHQETVVIPEPREKVANRRIR